MGKTRLVAFARKILQAGLGAVDPERLMNAALKREGEIVEIYGQGKRVSIDLRQYKHLFMVAIGKAAPFMASSFLDLLGDKTKGGIVLCLPGVPFSWPGIERVEAPHPFPDERSLAASKSVLNLAQKVDPHDLVFFLVSGGASAQLSLPVPPLRLQEKVQVIRALMEAGADIKELNVVRKHLSLVKGGRLGAAFQPATLVNLIISDVINDDLETIASAPSTWDSSTFQDARRIMENYGLWEKIPEAARKVIEMGRKGEIPETRKIEETRAEKLLNFIIGNNRMALEEAGRVAQDLNFWPIRLSGQERGEARDMAQVWGHLIQSIISSKEGLTRPLALISGGELTVTVKGKGKGGRNTEFCLALLQELMGSPIPPGIDWCGASLATDGRDGPTEAAGAIISPDILRRAQQKGLVLKYYLEDNDSLSFFEKVGGLIKTGATRTNVMDIRLFLLQKKNLPEMKEG